MWNIAHNLGGFAAPLVAGGFAKAMGWKWGMWAPGIIGLIVGTFVLLFWCGGLVRGAGGGGGEVGGGGRGGEVEGAARRAQRRHAVVGAGHSTQPPHLPLNPPPPHPLAPPPPAPNPRSKDKPEDVGFKPVEPVAEKPGAAKKKPDVLKQLVNTVLKNPFIWGMVRRPGRGGGRGALPWRLTGVWRRARRLRPLLQLRRAPASRRRRRRPRPGLFPLVLPAHPLVSNPPLPSSPPRRSPTSSSTSCARA
jgi:hypothetical protein